MRRLLSFFAVATLAACAPTSKDVPAAWDAFVDGYLEAHFAANPDFSVYQGRHDFDGKLPDWSKAGLDAELARLHAARDSAMAFDTTALDEPRRRQREYLLAVVEGARFWNEDARWPYRNPTFYNLDPNTYIARLYAPVDVRARALTAWAKAVPTAVQQIRQNLQTPLPKTYVQIGRIRFGGLVNFLVEDAPTAFVDAPDSVQSALREALTTASESLAGLDAWLASQEATATDDFAMGPELFSKMLLATERVDIPLDRLEALGEADLNRNLEAMQAACAEFAPGKNLMACGAQAGAIKPEGGPVEAARLQLDTLEQFVRTHDLVSVPGTEKAEVRESPPYQRSNSAYIDPPGTYDVGLPSVYYISPPDPSWTPAVQHDYLPSRGNLLFTSVHEVWPGHFLQFLHSNRSPDTFGRVFVGYAFAEGWAHYTEEMMWEAGLGDGSPEVHIGQLSEALLRNARFLSAIRLHARGMTVEQSEQMFREKGLQDLGTARQQAARGTYDPAYLNYTLGKLMIRQLRDDWTATHGGREGWKAFHDQFLSYGGPPIPIVRAAMLGADAGPVLR